MRNRSYLFNVPRNPIIQVLSLIAFGVILIGAVLMGAIILAAVFGLAVIAAAVFSVRLWWLRRKLGRRRRESLRTARGGELIDVEYTVVTERERFDRSSPRR